MILHKPRSKGGCVDLAKRLLWFSAVPSGYHTQLHSMVSEEISERGAAYEPVMKHYVIVSN